MKASTRRLRERSLQENLRAWHECHLLQGLNGRVLSRSARPDPDAILPRDPDAIKRVESFLIALMAAVYPPIDTSPMLGGPGQPSQREYIRRANSALRRYIQFPALLVDPETERLTSDMKHCGGDQWENGAVNAILSLLQMEQLYRIKRCACCEKWFYSLRDDQRFCGTACRQKEHSQSEAFKKKRREYMTDYREKGNEKRAKSRPSIQGNRKRRTS